MLYLASATAVLWSVGSLVAQAPPRASVRPIASPDLAARVFAPTDAGVVTAGRPEESPPAPLPIAGETADRGASLYGRSGCVLCHGPRAEGLTGPRIAGTQLALAAVRQQVRSPIHPRMPAFAPDQLSDEGIAAIYAFLQTLVPK